MAENEPLVLPGPQMTPSEKGTLLLDYVAGKRPLVMWNRDQKSWDLLDFRSAELQGAELAGADMRWADLAGANLEGANLRGADLTRANLVGANLRRAHLEDASMGGADMKEANLEGAYLTNTRLEGANLQRARLRRAQMERADLQGAHLDRANLEDARMSGVVLSRASAEEALFSGAQLKRAGLEGCSLFRADLQGADLEDARMSGAQLRGADLKSARLAGADLRSANLQETELSGADLTGVDLQCAIYNDRTRWPEHFDPPEEAFLLAPDAVLQAVDLEGADLAGVNLAGANLEGANLSGANLTGANLSGAEMVHANLSRADLTRANLEGANLAGSNLQWAQLRMSNLHWANLSRANLERANLEGAHMDGVDLVAASLERANLEGANLHEAYLNEADLQGANLQLANLDGAHLRETNLWEADLRGACIKSISGFPQDLEDCKISSLTFTESGWNLSTFLKWYQAGIDISDLENFPAGVQEWFRDNREGLTLYYRSTLDRLDRHLIEGLILGLLGYDTDCEINSFEQLDNRTVIRISARRQADLGAVAELLLRRVWERSDASEEQEQLLTQLSDVMPLPLLRRLSVTLDQGERMELWGFQEGELALVKSWSVRVDRSRALQNLLQSLFNEDELRDLLELDGEAPEGAKLAGSAAKALEERGLLDQPFFLQMREERPERGRDVRFVARLWEMDASQEVLLGESPDEGM